MFMWWNNHSGHLIPDPLALRCDGTRARSACLAGPQSDGAVADGREDGQRDAHHGSGSGSRACDQGQQADQRDPGRGGTTLGESFARDEVCSDADQDRARAESDQGAQGKTGVLDGAEAGRLTGRQGDAGQYRGAPTDGPEESGHPGLRCDQEGSRDGEAPERHGDGAEAAGAKQLGRCSAPAPQAMAAAETESKPRRSSVRACEVMGCASMMDCRKRAASCAGGIHRPDGYTAMWPGSEVV